MSSESGPDLFEVMKALTIAYPAAYQTLYDAKPITCSVTGTTFDAIPAPCAAVLDVSFFSYLICLRLGSTSCLAHAHDCRFCFRFFSSSLPYLNCVLLGQSADTPYQ